MTTSLFASASPDVLYIIDLSGYVFRAYHAMPEMTGPSGEPTNAVYGTVNMLERLVRQCRPAMLAVAMDAGRQTFRSEIFPAYKSNRPPPPEDLQRQMGRVAEIIDAFSIPILREEGVEADDLIACAAAQVRAHSMKMVVVSADKDLMQLVSPEVILWDTMRDRVFGVEEVEARFGVKVSQLRDLLALMGDTSDNIPGVPSVGPKTARDLLTEYGTLEGVYEHLDQIKRKKLRETLAENHEQAVLSQKLVTLRADCKIDFDIDALRYGGRDLARLRAIYAELGFHRLIDGLGGDGGPASLAAPASAKPAPPPPAPLAIETSLATSLSDLTPLLDAARSEGRLALSVETDIPSTLRGRLVGIGLSAAGGRGVYLPIAHRYVGAPKALPLESLRSELGSILADPAVAKLGHDLKRALCVLGRHGLELGGLAFDTNLAGYLLDAESSHTLESLCDRELGLALKAYDQLIKPARGQRLDFDQVAVEDAQEYSATRAAALISLAERLGRSLDEAGLTKVFERLEMPLVSQLAELELRGVLVDTARLAELGRGVDRTLAELEKRAQEIVGRPFNVNSPRQLETILFDELKLKPIKRTKTSRSTDAATLEALADEHPLPGVILEQRQLAKLKGTYIDALPQLVNPQTGRIHTTWEQAVAATGRLSSTDPNLQNIPVRSELGRAIRSAFVAPPGCQLVSGDYSQIELRVLAHLSKDAVLLDAFRTGQDIHTRTAIEIFGVKAEDVTSEMRRRAKAVNFGVIYGQGDSGLAKSLGITRAEASQFIATYFRRYEGVRRFMDETLAKARAGESVGTLLGRRRLLPDIRSANRARRLAAERIAMNTPIQGTAADLLKLAMLGLRKPVTPGSRMILTVHDELVFEVPDAEVAEAEERVRESMENIYELGVPLSVDVRHGKSWSEAH